MEISLDQVIKHHVELTALDFVGFLNSNLPQIDHLDGFPVDLDVILLVLFRGGLLQKESERSASLGQLGSRSHDSFQGQIQLIFVCDKLNLPIIEFLRLEMRFFAVFLSDFLRRPNVS